jgi:large subunit ribosomal protein L19
MGFRTRPHLPMRHPAVSGCRQMKVDPRVNVLDEIVADQLRTDLPELAAGDTVRVSAKVVEGNRERIQVFEGIVMRLRGGGITRSITVRRIASGVGVERTFKVNSPRIERIEVMRHGQVRRAQLYFLRKRVGKAATLRERRPKTQAVGAQTAGSKTKARGSKAKAIAATAEAPADASGGQASRTTPDSKA